MHVEFRCSEVQRACVFDPESFYRVKQQMYRETLPRGDDLPGPDVPLECLSLYRTSPSTSKASSSPRAVAPGKSQRQIDDERRYKPVLQVQFVLEQKIQLETSEVFAVRDSKQRSRYCFGRRRPSDEEDGPPAPPPSGASRGGGLSHGVCTDDAMVRTQRYNASFWEVLLAALPLRAVDASVKIRLVQMPPPLRTKRARRVVEEALGRAMDEDHMMHTPLCIGVGKITLKELLSVRGGVRMALQAKKGIANIVDSLNLNSTITHKILGKDEGGSAQIFLEVTAFSYGRASLSKLLLFPQSSESSYHHSSERRRRELGGGESSAMYGSSRFGADELVSRGGGLLARQMSSLSDEDDDGERSSAMSISSTGVYESPVTRFFFIPYLAAVDVLLGINDVLSWRRSFKTFLVVLICLVAKQAEVLTFLVLLLVFGIVLRFGTYMATLYSAPLPSVLEDAHAGGGPPISSRSSAKKKRSAPPPLRPTPSHNYLYGRQNKLLNALVRSQLLYEHGLSEASFYEIAFVFHLLRRRANSVISWVMMTCCLFILPSDLTFPILFFLLFFVYPLTLRLTIPRSAKQRRRRLLSSTYLWNSWRLNHPMKVARIVYIEPPERAPAPGNPSIKGMETELNSFAPSHFSSGMGVTHHQRQRTDLNLTMPLHEPLSPLAYGAPSSFGAQAAAAAAAKRKQTQNVAKLTFAVLSLTSLSSGKGGENNQLLPLLRNHWSLIKSLHCSAAAVRTGGGGGGGASMLLNNVAASSTHLHNDLPSVSGGDSSEFEATYATYLRETVKLLYYIRSKTALQVYVTSNTRMPLVSDGLKRLDSLIQSNWLLEHGEDDGITSTFLAMPPHYSFMVAQLAQTIRGTSTEAQGLAALAAYLLQGARLSIYTRGRGNRNCCVILPMQMESNRLERYRSLCPKQAQHLSTLIKALEEIWQSNSGTAGRPASAAPSKSMAVSPDMVLQIVKTHAEQLTGKLDVRSVANSRLHSFDREGSMTFPVVPCRFEEQSEEFVAPNRRRVSSRYVGSGGGGGSPFHHARTMSLGSNRTFPATSPVMSQGSVPIKKDKR